MEDEDYDDAPVSEERNYAAAVSFYKGPVTVTRPDGSEESFWDEPLALDEGEGGWVGVTHMVMEHDGRLSVARDEFILSSPPPEGDDLESSGARFLRGHTSSERSYGPGEWMTWHQDVTKAGEPRPLDVPTPDEEALETAIRRCRERWLAEYTNRGAERHFASSEVTLRRAAANRATNSPARVLVRLGKETIGRLVVDQQVLTLVDPALEPHREATIRALVRAGHRVRKPIKSIPPPNLLATVSWVGAWHCFAVNVGEDPSDANPRETRLTIAVLFDAGKMMCGDPGLVVAATDVLARHGLKVSKVVDVVPAGYRSVIADRVGYDLDQALLRRYDPPSASAHWRANMEPK